MRAGDPLTTVSRLVKEMKRQVTGFAIESGFSVPGRRVPAHLVADFQELADDVRGAVETLVESHRPGILWANRPSPKATNAASAGTRARPTAC